MVRGGKGPGGLYGVGMSGPRGKRPRRALWGRHEWSEGEKAQEGSMG